VRGIGAISPYAHTQLPGAGMWWRSWTASESSRLSVLAKASWYSSGVKPTALCQPAAAARFAERSPLRRLVNLVL